MVGSNWRPTTTALLLVLLVYPLAANGQSESDPLRTAPHERTARPLAWPGELEFLSGNAALGGLTATLIQKLRGGSFWEAFVDGALGGAVAYAGKRIAVERFYGAGLVGREVAAVGTSMVRSAADGRGALERLVLPIGVARLYLWSDTTSALQMHTRVKLDVLTLLATAYLGLRDNVDFDFGASISAGTPVFFSREQWIEPGWIASQVGGVIWLRGGLHAPRANAEVAALFAHERVHVAQDDFSFLTWGDPLEGLLTDRFPGGAWIDRRLDLGLHLGGWGVANRLISYNQRPWEHEAHFLSRVSSHWE